MPESMHNFIYRAVKQYHVRFHEIFLDNAMFYKKKSEKIECRKHVGQIPRDLCHSIPADNHRFFVY